VIYKLIGCIFVIASCSGIGMYYSGEFRVRLEDMKELKKMIILLRGDIRYANTPLPEAISSIARKNNGRFEKFFVFISNKLNDFPGVTFASVWKESVETNLNQTAINKKDKVDLVQFGESLGYLDKDMQINTLDLYLEQLENVINDLLGNVKEKTYLYNTLGVMAGLFISIIMM